MELGGGGAAWVHMAQKRDTQRGPLLWALYCYFGFHKRRKISRQSELHKKNSAMWLVFLNTLII
jgi:hypothetical protein